MCWHALSNVSVYARKIGVQGITSNKYFYHPEVDMTELKAINSDIEEIQNLYMELIVNAGEARSCSFEAIGLAKEKKFQEAKNCLSNSKESALLAHKIQTDLIRKEACGELVNISITLIHAQDHLMTALLAREVSEEFIAVHEELAEIKKQLSELKGE